MASYYEWAQRAPWRREDPFFSQHIPTIAVCQYGQNEVLPMPRTREAKAAAARNFAHRYNWGEIETATMAIASVIRSDFERLVSPQTLIAFAGPRMFCTGSYAMTSVDYHHCTPPETANGGSPSMWTTCQRKVGRNCMPGPIVDGASSSIARYMA